VVQGWHRLLLETVVGIWGVFGVTVVATVAAALDKEDTVVEIMAVEVGDMAAVEGLVVAVEMVATILAVAAAEGSEEEAVAEEGLAEEGLAEDTVAAEDMVVVIILAGGVVEAEGVVLTMGAGQVLVVDVDGVIRSIHLSFVIISKSTFLAESTAEYNYHMV
jgi:hypothetical protein